MDNLTHSLFGALLGRMGLKRLSGRAMPTLILGANAPDIDVFAPLVGAGPGLISHRGFSHGIGGMVILPILLWGLVLVFERWRPGSEPVRPWPLLLLAAIAVVSHPLLDFLTGYGTRLLEPFSDRWFYGDTLFIVDVWIWIALILGFELSRWREKGGRHDWHRPAIAVFGAILAYIAINFAITARAEAVTWTAPAPARPKLVVATQVPVAFWERHMLWRTDHVGGSGRYRPFNGVQIDPQTVPLRLDDPRLAAAARTNERARAFLFWSRMPLVIEQDGKAFLADQRFLARARSSFLVPLDSDAQAP